MSHAGLYRHSTAGRDHRWNIDSDDPEIVELYRSDLSDCHRDFDAGPYIGSYGVAGAQASEAKFSRGKEDTHAELGHNLSCDRVDCRNFRS